MNDLTPGRPIRGYAKDGRWRDFSTDDLVGRDLIQFQGWKCSAGVKNIAIKPNGRIRAAACGIGGNLGNVFEDFNIPEEWLTCTAARCTCGADLFIPKAQSPVSQTLLRKSLSLPTQKNLRDEDLFNELTALERVHAADAKQVYWEVTHFCNYNCSYCTPAVHNKTDKFRPFHEMAMAIEKINEKFGKGEKINFIISGGEPTLIPYFVDWIRLIKALGHHISIHSNGSRPPAIYEKLIPFCDVNLSLHFEFWRQENFFAAVEAMVTKKNEVVDQSQIGHLEVKIMMPPGKYQEAMNVETRLKSISGFVDVCTWSVVPIRVGDILDSVDPRYSPKEASLFGDRIQA